MSGHEGVDGTVVGVNIRGAGLRAVTGVAGRVRWRRRPWTLRGVASVARGRCGGRRRARMRAWVHRGSSSVLSMVSRRVNASRSVRDHRGSSDHGGLDGDDQCKQQQGRREIRLQVQRIEGQLSPFLLCEVSGEEIR